MALEIWWPQTNSRSFLNANDQLTFAACETFVEGELQLQEVQLVYASQPFGYDDLSLTGILLRARKNNEENGITGALICRDDLFLQMLEGPRDKVIETFARIERDERHVNVTELFCRGIDKRLFPEWSMRHDPVQSWMWTPEQVAKGAVHEAQEAEIAGIFERLAKQPPQGL